MRGGVDVEECSYVGLPYRKMAQRQELGLELQARTLGREPSNARA